MPGEHEDPQGGAALLRRTFEFLTGSKKKKEPHLRCGSFLVDLMGFEPTTSRMRTERAPNCATGPNNQFSFCIIPDF